MRAFDQVFRGRYLLAGVTAIALAAFSGAGAQAAGDAASGAAVAQRWCASCHVAGQTANATVPQGPPTFATIAGERTPDALRAFLSKPHPPMPPVELSRADIDNLIAYIETQR